MLSELRKIHSYGATVNMHTTEHEQIKIKRYGDKDID